MCSGATCAKDTPVAKGMPWPTDLLTVSYQDFVFWQHKRVSEKIDHQAKFWKSVLGDELPPLPLPTDRPRTRSASTKGKRIPFELPMETAVAVRHFAQQHALTPQIVMLSALYALLARMTSARDIVIASPVDARTRSSIEGLVGAFVNLLLLRITVDPGRTFADFVTTVRDLCLTAYDNQELPPERLDVRSPRTRDGGISPAFQVEFSYQQVSQRGSHMGELSLSQLNMDAGNSTNDLTVWVKDWGEKISGAIEFRLDLFDHETIEHWMSCYKHLVRELVRNPLQPIHDVDFLGGERERISNRMAEVSAAPPAWAARRLDGKTAVAPQQLQVVDDEDQPRPFGIPGHLVVQRDGALHRVGVQARLVHDGTLVEVLPEAGSRSKAAPVKTKELSTELEMRVCLLFADLLGLPSVGVEQDYFELGGNSLIAVRLFGAIHDQFGVRLPMATILDANTPRRLARTISQKIPNRESCVVRLKDDGGRGSGGPMLFLIHDGDGETLLYRGLALRMPAHVPVFGIEPLSVGRIAMAHTTIEEMAKHYLGEIRKRQPKGPYYLGGLCAGGLIAFEVARQLEECAEEVRHLALIEASPPRAQKRVSTTARRWQRFSGLFHGASPASAGEIARKGIQKLTSYVSYEARERYQVARARVLCLLLRHTFPLGKDWPQVLPPPTVRELYALAVREYTPSKLHRTQAVLYRATTGQADDLPLAQILVDPLFGWQELFSRKAEVVDVPGGHGTLLREPFVLAIASDLHASLMLPSNVEKLYPLAEAPPENASG
jgi:thioesterase domain-containing protein